MTDQNDLFTPIDNTSVAPSATFVLPDRSQNQELVVIGTDDDHYNSMVNDPVFYKTMQQRNSEYNNMKNLNNPELTKAGQNAADGADVLVPNTNENWINTKWRPAMSWMYMIVCICDFILFPIGWTAVQALTKGSITTPWQPITLEGAGLFHIAMGAVIGVTSFGRTQEKIQGVAGPNIGIGPGTTPSTPVNSTTNDS